MIGTTLNGRYKIEEQVGEGGMAVTYRAHDNLLQRTVAVKVMREQYHADREFMARFQREAQSTASLSHPNIAAVYDIGQEGDRLYIVMEYVEGDNLEEIVRARGPLPPPR